jgi:Proteasome subunit
LKKEIANLRIIDFGYRIGLTTLIITLKFGCIRLNSIDSIHSIRFIRFIGFIEERTVSSSNKYSSSRSKTMMNPGSFAPPLMEHSEGRIALGGEKNVDGALRKPLDYPGREQPYEHRFSPYDFNGGTVAGVSGEDYLVIAADTRMSSGYEILSRNTTKLHQLNPNAILASSGCKTDMDQLRSELDIKSKVRLVLYRTAGNASTRGTST